MASLTLSSLDYNIWKGYSPKDGSLLTRNIDIYAVRYKCNHAAKNTIIAAYKQTHQLAAYMYIKGL